MKRRINPEFTDSQLLDRLDDLGRRTARLLRMLAKIEDERTKIWGRLELHATDRGDTKQLPERDLFTALTDG